MTIRKINTIIICLSLILLTLLSSCSLENNEKVIEKADLDVVVTSLDSKTINPEGNLASTIIVKYKLKGSGPAGETFSWRANSDGKFKVFGIPQGNWILTAEGYSENGTKIAIGSNAVVLSKGNTKASVVLNKLYGNGTAHINVTWNTSMVKTPVVGVRIKPINGTYVDKSFKSQTSGSAVYEENLPSGSYIVNALLYEDSAKTKLIAGTVDVIRIVDNKTSTGNLALVIGSIATDYNVSLIDPTMAPLEGSMNVTIGEPNIEHKSIVNATVTLSAQTQAVMANAGVTVNDINIEWFLDGAPLVDENKADNKLTGTFTLFIGRRNLSALLTSTKLGSSGNCKKLVNISQKSYIILEPGEVLSTLEGIEFPEAGKFIVGYTPILADKNDYKKSISLPYKNNTSTRQMLYPIYIDQDTFVTTTNGSIVIKDAYKDVKLVVMPESGVTTIGGAAFRYCTALSSITIPNSVTTIGSYSFSDCTALSSITIPNSVTTIGEKVFYRCTALSSITIPNSVTTIGNEAFSNCTALSSVTIDNSVTTIGEYAFYRCTALSSITIPNSVTTIGDFAFGFCTALSSITIPNSVTTIGSSVFYAWKNTQTIYIRASSKPAGWDADWKSSCNAKIVWGYTGN